MANTEGFLVSSVQEEEIHLPPPPKPEISLPIGATGEEPILVNLPNKLENIPKDKEDVLIDSHISDDNTIQKKLSQAEDISVISGTEDTLFGIDIDVSEKSSNLSHLPSKSVTPKSKLITFTDQSSHIRTRVSKSSGKSVKATPPLEIISLPSNDDRPLVEKISSKSNETKKLEEAKFVHSISIGLEETYDSISANESIIKTIESEPEPAPTTSMDKHRYNVSGWDEDNEDKPRDENDDKMGILKAAETGDLKKLKKLIDADHTLINFRDSDGYTALHCACYSNHIECVDYLLSKGANIAARTELLWQPLHSCCQWNHKKIAARLLQTGADVNALSEGGQTPLHIAAVHGASYETAQLLLLSPYLDPEIRNRTRETATEIARRTCKFYNIFDMADPIIRGIDD